MPPNVSRIAIFTPLHHLISVCRTLFTARPANLLIEMVWIVIVVNLLVPLSFRLITKRRMLS